MSRAAKGAKGALHIEGEFTIYRAVELKQALLARLDAKPTLELDLSAVSEIDSAGVQLLMLAKRSASARKGELRLVGPSAAVMDVLALLDLSAYFGDFLPARS